MAEQATATAKQTIADDKETRAKQDAQRAAVQGKPTPTQEENDLVALGAQLDEHEADGSSDPYATKQVEAKRPGGGYQTRTTEPAPAHKK